MTNALAEQIGDRLKRGRIALGYTQKRVSEAVGGKLRGWQEYERGRSVPGGAVLAALVEQGLNANWILTGEGPMLLKGVEKAAESEDAPSSNAINQQLDQIEKALTLQKAPITLEQLAQSPELQRLQGTLSTMVDDKSLSARQHTRASFLLHIAFGTPHTELAKAHRRETQARYHDALKDFEEAVKLVEYRPPGPVQEGFKIAMFAHGLTKEGAIILLRFLKMSDGSSAYF